MVRRVVWTKKAKDELIAIFQYWNNRNKSNIFSIKLNTQIEEELKLILEFPKIGRVTDIPNVYVKVIQKYLLYYEFVDDVLYVLTIRHGTRNPKTLKLK